MPSRRVSGIWNSVGAKSPTVRSQTLLPLALSSRISAAISRIRLPTSVSASWAWPRALPAFWVACGVASTSGRDICDLRVQPAANLIDGAQVGQPARLPSWAHAGAACYSPAQRLDMRTFWLLAALSLTTLALEGCSSSCGPSNCSGCCDGNNQCQIPSLQTCGLGGAACSACVGAQQCIGGVCQNPGGAGANGTGNGAGNGSANGSGSDHRLHHGQRREHVRVGLDGRLQHHDRQHRCEQLEHHDHHDLDHVDDGQRRHGLDDDDGQLERLQQHRRRALSQRHPPR